MGKRQKEFKKLKRNTARKNKTGRVFIVTVGFIVFLALSLYSLLYIKKKISEEIPKRLSSSDLIERIEEVDSYVVAALFNLGISIKDVESKKVYQRKRGELTWEFKDIKVYLPKGVTEKEVKRALAKALSKKPDVEWKLKRDGNLLVSEVEVYNIPTHKLSFLFYKEKPEKKQEKIVKEKEPPLRKLAKLPKEKSVIREPERGIFEKEKPKVVIIVDDLGLNKEPIDKLLEIPAPLSFAVLPNLPFSQYAAEMAHKNGRDVILHLPMEPKDSSGYTGSDAGDGVLLVGLPKKEILAKLEKDLVSVPYIKGVNNHMGSKFTENAELMELVLKRIKSRGLFFVDSRTSQNTTGFYTAKKLGMRAAQRDVFLDEGSQRTNYIRSQIEKLISVSKEKGYAIGICHPYPNTVKIISETIPKIEKEVEIISISSAVN